MAPVFSAVSSSARQLLVLLRCIAFTSQTRVRIAADGLRFSTEQGSVMEAFVFLEKALFTSYVYNESPSSSSQDDSSQPPAFQIDLFSLLETLNIFSLSDPNATKRPGDYDGFATHRFQRHAGINAFSNHALGITGVCTFTYEGAGSPLSIHMSEAGVTTTCDLTTYEPDSTEDIPFDREALALKTIMRSASLLDAVTELGSMSPVNLTIVATPTSRSGANLSLSAAGALGSSTVEFATDTASETPILETFSCPSRSVASFNFGLLKSAQRAMAAATKVSLRLDEEGVLSLQFLVEVEAGSAGGEAVAFVDFRMVPLVEGEGEVDDTDGDVSP